MPVSDERLLYEVIVLHKQLTDALGLVPAGVFEYLGQQLRRRSGVFAQHTRRNQQVGRAFIRLTLTRDELHPCAQTAEGGFNFVLKLRRAEVFRAQLAEAGGKDIRCTQLGGIEVGDIKIKV